MHPEIFQENSRRNTTLTRVFNGLKSPKLWANFPTSVHLQEEHFLLQFSFLEAYSIVVELRREVRLRERIEYRVFQRILHRCKPHDSNVDVTCVHLLPEEFLESRGHQPKIAIISIGPTYFSDELQFLRAVSHNPERRAYLNKRKKRSKNRNGINAAAFYENILLGKFQ